MLYHICDFVNDQTLVMLCYSFAYSRLTYEITAWGTAAQNQLHEIEVKLNNIVRTLIWNTKFSHITKLYKKFDFLKLCDVCKLELAKFMHQLFKRKLSYLIHAIMISQRLKKFMIMKSGDQAGLIIFYLEFLNLLGKKRLNSGVLNCGTKLAKT